MPPAAGAPGRPGAETWTVKRQSAHDGRSKGPADGATPRLTGTIGAINFCSVQEATAMPDHDIVVVGASAGGVEALAELAASLPANLPAAVFVVLHVPATGTSALPDILSRHGPLPASHVKDGELVERARIYVAPPDHHVLLRGGHVRLTRGPRENGHRPAVDSLFRSAAREYATRVIGVVLSGALDDGTAGLLAIKSRGGVAVVQEAGDALYPGMPYNALEHVRVDHVVAVASMGKLLARLAAEPAGGLPGPVRPP